MVANSRCTALPVIDNGYAEVYTTDQESQAYIHCDTGYRFPDGTIDKSVTCGSNNEWHGVEHCAGYCRLWNKIE